MADKVGKVHPQDCLFRKPTRDTDNFSEIVSCISDHPKGKQQQKSRHSFIKASQHILRSSVYCRVCLEEEEESNALLHACHCRDLIHESCLLEWVQHRIETSNDSKNLKCQICREAYTVTFEPYLAFTCEISKQKYQNYRREFAQSLLAFIVFLTLFLLTVLLLIKMEVNEELSHSLEAMLALPKNTVVAILVMGLLFLGIFSLGLGYRLVKGYCYGTRWRVAQRSIIA